MSAQAMPGTASSALDNGMYKIWFARNYRTASPTRCCSTMRSPPWARAFRRRSMAAALSEPPRARRLRRRRLHDELAGARNGGAPQLNLVVLVLEDNAYGMIRWKQAVDGPDFGLAFGNPDFVAYAKPMAPRAVAWKAADWRLARSCFQRAAACILSSCRSTTPRTSVCWWRNCPPVASMSKSHSMRIATLAAIVLGLLCASPAMAEPAALTKKQSDAQNAYNNARTNLSRS